MSILPWIMVVPLLIMLLAIVAAAFIWPMLSAISAMLPAGRGKPFCRIGAHAMETIDHEFAWRCWVDVCKHCTRRTSGLND
jgi:hypothetical protein